MSKHQFPAVVVVEGRGPDAPLLAAIGGMHVTGHVVVARHCLFAAGRIIPGGDFGTSSARARAGAQGIGFQIHARAAVLEVALHWAIGGQHALDLGITRQHAKAADGPSYDGSSVRAGWPYRFH